MRLCYIFILFICFGVATSQNQDCITSTQLCSNSSFSGNSSGNGTTQELGSTNKGCLGVEHQSSWYIFQAATTGSISLEIFTNVDYDFAVWGPNVGCGSLGTPARCSFAAGGGNTGLGNGATDFSEGTGGDRWVAPLNVVSGQVFIMLIDNYTSNSSAFNISFNTSTASLNCTALPVELILFNAENFGSYNEITWSTAAEINNAYFTVERSTDGIHWDEATTVNGAGNSMEPKHYNYKDYNVSDQVLYYKLRQTDFNNNYKYSAIVSVNPETSKAYISGFKPNPTDKNINFDFYTPVNGNLLIEITDYTGSSLLKKEMILMEGKTLVELETQQLAPGIYFTKLNFDKANYHTITKLIKN